MVEKKVIVNKVGVSSLGIVVGCVYALFGLVVGAIMTLISILGALAAQSFGAFGAISLLFGVGSIILLPIFYGIIGIIVGILAAWFYNMVAKWIGGIKLEVGVK